MGCARPEAAAALVSLLNATFFLPLPPNPRSAVPVVAGAGNNPNNLIT